MTESKLSTPTTSYKNGEFVIETTDSSSPETNGNHVAIEMRDNGQSGNANGIIKDKDDDDDDDGDVSVTSVTSSSGSSRGRMYNWRLYFPATGNPWHYFRWLMVGGGALAKPQSDHALNDSLAGLARCLIFLREYLSEHGMPEKGGVRDQEYVLREIVRDLYAGGAPLWALEPVLQKAAEGLTGQPNVNWQLYPRKAFVYSPSAGTTSMFKIDRGFNIRKMDAMEEVAIRLASFASNVQAVSNIPARFPNPSEFRRAARTQSVRHFMKQQQDPHVLAHKILKLASKQQGLFYYVNSREYQGNNKHVASTDDEDDGGVDVDGVDDKKAKAVIKDGPDFWVVTEQERECFSRLACLEAMRSIDRIDKEEEGRKMNKWLVIAYRVLASAGACAFWFGGSWYDMIVAGLLAVFVASIGTSSYLSKQERLIYEVVASFFVGMTAGLIALSWPDDTCFAPMAIAGILDILQGFRVVYAVIEIMSKHTISGTADLMEGILFTGLIASSLRLGQYVAASIKGELDTANFENCGKGINELWFILFVPLAALSWSGLFTPKKRDLFPMTMHGILGYAVNFGLSKAGASNELNNFVSASAITLSAGLVSRFNGRQAVGNTVAGMYVLLPGAYLVKSLYSTTVDGSFFIEIVKMAVIIGIGGWTGSILCSPTLLGTTGGLLRQQQNPFGLRRGSSEDRRQAAREEDRSVTPTTMLFF